MLHKSRLRAATRGSPHAVMKTQLRQIHEVTYLKKRGGVETEEY